MTTAEDLDEDETPTPIDLGIKFRTSEDREKVAAERFAKDVATHELTIVRDDGTYRHLKIRRPDDSAHWYEIVTWAGALMIRGDMGTYAFSRLPDMFEFFRSKTGYINTQYWAEKLIFHDRDGVKDYSEDAFRERVAETLAEWVSDISGWPESEEKIAALIAAVKDRVISCGGDEESARYAANQFWHDEHQFSDTWEWGLSEYRHQFLWCLHAIVHAINMYDATKAGTQAGPGMNDEAVMG